MTCAHESPEQCGRRTCSLGVETLGYCSAWICLIPEFWRASRKSWDPEEYKPSLPGIVHLLPAVRWSALGQERIPEIRLQLRFHLTPAFTPRAGRPWSPALSAPLTQTPFRSLFPSFLHSCLRLLIPSANVF